MQVDFAAVEGTSKNYRAAPGGRAGADRSPAAGGVSKWVALFAFMAYSSGALQACGQGTPSAVQVAVGRPWALSEHLPATPPPLRDGRGRKQRWG